MPCPTPVISSSGAPDHRNPNLSVAPEQTQKRPPNNKASKSFQEISRAAVALSPLAPIILYRPPHVSYPDNDKHSSNFTPALDGVGLKKKSLLPEGPSLTSASKLLVALVGAPQIHLSESLFFSFWKAKTLFSISKNQDHPGSRI